MAKSKIKSQEDAIAAIAAALGDGGIAACDRYARKAIGSIGSAALGLRAKLMNSESDLVPIHITARRADDTAEVAKLAWMVASLVIQRVTTGKLGVPRPNHDSELGLKHAARTLEDATAALVRGSGIRAKLRAFKTDADTLMMDINGLFCEVALEEFDAALGVLSDESKTIMLYWKPVPPGTAYVDLIESVLRTARLLVADSPLLQAEVAASDWWYSRWIGVTPDVPGSASAALIRANEWIFGGRSTVALGSPIVTALTATPYADRLPPKQLTIAAAFSRSHTSLFAVRRRGKNESTLEDLADGGSVVIHEQSPTMAYRVGDIGVGRIFRIGDSHVMRSAGMVFIPPPEKYTENPEPVIETFRKMRTELGDPDVGAEAFMSMYFFGRSVPNVIEPAASKEDARERCAALTEMLQGRGMERELIGGEFSDEVERIIREAPKGSVIALEVDDALGAYMNALQDQRAS
jgi:hypothetical protein